ncbi:MAG: glycosyltransferase family 39 protein [Parvibaculum sp.]|uniref:ArnT family glycosyltransferase n=1 Tax=Parvibaculum sp. TaxID=2024848 RepID=UPI0025D40FA0|nr:glycosyltransferase family 39 protein [Parvibaculum sp.]MCE9650776.1 glycosyltransferase family 39 protein [Parvibaculum sp.]
MTDFLVKAEEFLRRRGALTLVIAAAFAVLFLFDIGNRNISSPDEGRYIEIPREMVESGDYVLPRLNGVLYFEKPPLFYWLEASAIKTLGISEGTMRLWPALLGIFGALMTYGVARRFYGRAAGFVAGGVLATSLMYYALARFVIIDMSESVLMSAALFAFLLSAEERDEKKALWWARGGHAAAALAVLAKGLIGVLLPGLIGLVWIALIGRWSFVRRALCPSGIAIFLAIALPWHILAAMRNHDFLWFYIVHEHFLRFTTTVHRRNEPMWYFIPVLLVGFLPWTGYLWHAVKDALPGWTRRSEKPVELFLLLWAGIIFVFFTFSDSKLPPYILPIFPPLAVLLGRVLGPRLGSRDDLPLGRWVFAGFFGLLAAGVAVAYNLPSLRQDDNVGAYLGPVAYIVFPMAVVFALGSLAAIVLPRRYGERATVAVIALTAVLGWTGISLVASEADPNSVKTVAEVIQKYRHHNETVASYGTFFYDLPVYLDDKVVVVGNTAEFDFGMTQEDVSKYVATPDAFSKVWNGPDLVFMVVRTRLFSSWETRGLPKRMCVIARTDRAIGLSNLPIFKDGKMICDPWYDLDDGPNFNPQGGDPNIVRTPELKPSFQLPSP